MARRKALTEEQKNLIGRVCVNCGSAEDIEYHHVVPLCNGGNDIISNIVPLCHVCHNLAHEGRNLTEYKRYAGTLTGRRPSNCDDDTAFEALDMLAAGEIGVAKCKKLMHLSENTFPSTTIQFKKWCAMHGIERMRSWYDLSAMKAPENLNESRAVGWIKYLDGHKEDIMYKASDVNDTIYTFADKKLFKKPCTIKRALKILEKEKYKKTWAKRRKEFLEAASEEQGA